MAVRDYVVAVPTEQQGAGEQRLHAGEMIPDAPRLGPSIRSSESRLQIPKPPLLRDGWNIPDPGTGTDPSPSEGSFSRDSSKNSFFSSVGGHSRGSRRGSASPRAWREPTDFVREKGILHALRHSATAKAIRDKCRSNEIMVLMLVALVFSISLPDIWVLAGINENSLLDFVLTTVMCLFWIEITTLSAVDASYPFGFLFFIDIIGTFCMVFDLSYTGLTSNTEPHFVSDPAPAISTLRSNAASSVLRGNTSLVLLVARVTKVLKIGHLSRLVRMFKTSNDMRHRVDRKISAALRNLLVTRIACLTILLIVVMFVVALLDWPSDDSSMAAWAQTLSLEAANDRKAQLDYELEMMVDYYAVKGYGPFKACSGSWLGDNFECTLVYTDWSPRVSAPPRGASEYLVHTDTFMVFFNMHQPLQVQAGSSLVTAAFIMTVLVVSGMGMTNVVNQLTAEPLERVMSTVNTIATTVFKLGADLGQEELFLDATDRCSHELQLLEKVVQKLAVVAELHTGKKVQVKEDMSLQDRALINMMQGNSAHARTTQLQRRPEARHSIERIITKKLSLDMDGMDVKDFATLAFSPLGLSREERRATAAWCMNSSTYGFDTPDWRVTLSCFVAASEADYPENPFHNFSHAVDVLHGVVNMIRLMQANKFLSDLELFTLLVSALAHDLGHLGVNNGYLSETGHALAVQYNDKSPLENMHCAKLYTIVGNRELNANVFHALTKEEYRETRKSCIDIILHTDMAYHMSMIKELQLLYEMNSAVFRAQANELEDEMGNNVASPMVPQQAVFAEPAAKAMAMKCLLHSADISNPARVWEVSYAWAMIVLEEFFAQGDLEKEMGIPVHFLNNRETLNRPSSQIGFVEFMIAPLFVAQTRLWPAISEYNSCLADNLGKWCEMYEETKPGDEDVEKTRAKVLKTQQSLQRRPRRRSRVDLGVQPK